MGWCALTHLVETLAPDQEGVVPVEASTKRLTAASPGPHSRLPSRTADWVAARPALARNSNPFSRHEAGIPSLALLKEHSA